MYRLTILPLLNPLTSNSALFLVLENVPLSSLFLETCKLSLTPLFYFSHLAFPRFYFLNIFESKPFLCICCLNSKLSTLTWIIATIFSLVSLLPVWSTIYPVPEWFFPGKLQIWFCYFKLLSSVPFSVAFFYPGILRH